MHGLWRRYYLIKQRKVAEKVSLIHGAGGEMMQSLIGSVFCTSSSITTRAASAWRRWTTARRYRSATSTSCLTTDNHVIKPIFFPGGDIGRLSISGTVNDLAMMGAKPMALTNGVVLPEGFPIEDLRKIVKSVDEALEEAELRAGHRRHQSASQGSAGQHHHQHFGHRHHATSPSGIAR